MSKISKTSLSVPYTNAATADKRVEPISASSDASARHKDDFEARIHAQEVAHDYNQTTFNGKGEIVDAPAKKRLLVIT